MRPLAEVLFDPRMPEVQDGIKRLGGLASQADLARRWGISRQRVHQLTRETGFPSPAGEVNGQPVWFVAAADQWRKYRELYLAEAALRLHTVRAESPAPNSSAHRGL
jgi:hypothetical protein